MFCDRELVFELRTAVAEEASKQLQGSFIEASTREAALARAEEALSDRLTQCKVSFLQKPDVLNTLPFYLYLLIADRCMLKKLLQKH